MIAARYRGIRVVGDGIAIVENEIRDCADGAIFAFAVSDGATMKIEGNDIRKSAGIEAIRGRAFVRKNQLASCPFGIYVRATHADASSQVSENRVELCPLDGIVAESDGAGLIVVDKNRVSGVGNCGLRIQPDVGDVLVRFNEIDGTGRHGIEVRASTFSHPAGLQGNRIKNAGGNGVDFYNSDESPNAPSISSFADRVDHVVGAGFYVDGSNAKILAGKVSLCGLEGIAVIGGFASIENCTIKTNGRDGVRIDGTSAAISGNSINKNRGSGVDLAGGFDHVVNDNECSDNGHEGIDNDGTLSRIDFNTCRKNAAGFGPDVAGKGHGDGTIASFEGNQFDTGGPAVLQRLDFAQPKK